MNKRELKAIQPVKTRSSKSPFSLRMWSANHYYMYILLQEGVVDSLSRIKTKGHLRSFLANRLLPGHMVISFNRQAKRHMFINTGQGLVEMLYYDMQPTDMETIYKIIVATTLHNSPDDVPSLVAIKLGHFDSRKIGALLRRLANMAMGGGRDKDRCIIS